MIFSITAITKTPSIAYAEKDSKKKSCKENDGNWKDGNCYFKTDDEDKADQFRNEVDKRAFEEERAAKEDVLCDDEDAETTNIEICSSQDLTLDEVFAEKYNKEN